jgi:hypothetical protein
MILTSELEVANTRAKLATLEARYQKLRSEEWREDELRLASMRSLKKLINQFTEEIVRYQTRQPANGKPDNGQAADAGDRRSAPASNPS